MPSKFADDLTGWRFEAAASPADALDAAVDALLAGDPALADRIAAGGGAVSEGAGPHKYSSTHVPLTGPAALALLRLAASVRDEDLADDGREDEPHVTIRYGLWADDPAEVVPLLQAAGPVRLTLGRASVFAGAETGKDYDVIKVGVASPDLVRLNAALAALPHTDTFREYRPHATVAYVRAGLGAGYAARMEPVNLDVVADRVVFSDRSGRQVVVPLDGSGVAEDRSGLVKKTITNHAGHKQVVWVRPGETHPDEAPAAGDAGGAGARTHPDAPPADHMTAGLAEDLAAADPGLAKNPGLVKRLEAAAVKVGARVYLFLLKHHDTVQAAGNVLGAVLDLPSDMHAKFAYQPTTSSGTAAANPVFDPAKAAGLPVSGHIVATIAAQVLVKGGSWVAKKLRGKTGEAAGDPVHVAAVILAAVLADLAGGQAPDVAGIEESLRAALAAKKGE